MVLGIDLVILDLTAFGLRVSVNLGTPTINKVMNVVKDSKIDELSVPLNGLRISFLLAGLQAELSFKNDITTSQTPGPADLNEAVKQQYEKI